MIVEEVHLTRCMMKYTNFGNAISYSGVYIDTREIQTHPPTHIHLSIYLHIHILISQGITPTVLTALVLLTDPQTGSPRKEFLRGPRRRRFH